jgi:4-amino-4-deoxy-L-arabinose transferase-like glycosyltransferase
MMTRFKLPLIFQCLIFLLPLNIYMWGDWLIVSVQWALFRYMQSPYGASLILGNNDILYILRGQSTGLYNIGAVVFWATGVLILLIGLIVTIVAYAKEEPDNIRTASYFTLAGGIFLGLSALCRFNGGFAIPVGVPIILIIGWWMYKEADETDETDNEPGNEMTGPE